MGGAGSFEKFFNSYQFERVFFNTLKLSMYSLVAGFPLPILLALCLNSVRNKRYRSAVENITYMPYFISTVVIVGIINQVFNTRIGLFSMAYRALIGRKCPICWPRPRLFRTCTSGPEFGRAPAGAR